MLELDTAEFLTSWRPFPKAFPNEDVTLRRRRFLQLLLHGYDELGSCRTASFPVPAVKGSKNRILSSKNPVRLHFKLEFSHVSTDRSSAVALPTVHYMEFIHSGLDFILTSAGNIFA